MSKTNVLLLFNPKEAEEVLLNLLSLDEFDSLEWNFRTCTESKSLMHEQKPDVLIMSRFVSGIDKGLKEIKNKFAGVRMVFHVGRLNESAKSFIVKAEKLGYRNFITGTDLRGDRPYTLPIAIRHDYTDIARADAVQSDNPGLMISVLVFGSVSLGQDVETAVVKKATDAKKLLSKNRIDAVVVQADHKGSEEFVRSIRKSYAGPVLVLGGYAPELISLGATGCIQDGAEIAKYVEMGRVLS